VAEFQWSEWLPYIFAALMGIAILVYVILDGFDLGIGILSPLADDTQKDRMVSAIGPFWDANETWLVLAVGLLLVAFPVAHGVILTTLYFPVAVLLIGLILRGVAFEFRAKVSLEAKPSWNRMFFHRVVDVGSGAGIYARPSMCWDWTPAGRRSVSQRLSRSVLPRPMRRSGPHG
jgi:cytochrome d ubiquinol oxidase subunit II